MALAFLRHLSTKLNLLTIDSTFSTNSTQVSATAILFNLSLSGLCLSRLLRPLQLPQQRLCQLLISHRCYSTTFSLSSSHCLFVSLILPPSEAAPPSLLRLPLLFSARLYVLRHSLMASQLHHRLSLSAFPATVALGFSRQTLNHANCLFLSLAVSTSHQHQPRSALCLHSLFTLRLPSQPLPSLSSSHAATSFQQPSLTVLVQLPHVQLSVARFSQFAVSLSHSSPPFYALIIFSSQQLPLDRSPHSSCSLLSRPAKLFASALLTASQLPQLTKLQSQQTATAFSASSSSLSSLLLIAAHPSHQPLLLMLPCMAVSVALLACFTCACMLHYICWQLVGTCDGLCCLNKLLTHGCCKRVCVTCVKEK